MSGKILPFARRAAPDPADRLEQIEAQIAAIERAAKRLDALKRERIALRRAVRRPNRSRLPYSTLGHVARRSALYAVLREHGMNWHADLTAKDAPAAVLGWALADLREREWRLAALVQEQAETLGGGRDLMEAARRVERDLLRAWWLASSEGEAAAQAGDDVARRRADAHVGRHATPAKARPRPLAAALYKVARAKPRALADLRDMETTL